MCLGYMAYLWMLCQTEVLSSFLRSEEPSALFGATANLSSGFHLQTNGQTEQTNQDLEAALSRICARNQSSSSPELAWVEYAHNFLTSSAPGMSPFECSLGYQPPLFPVEEAEV